MDVHSLRYMLAWLDSETLLVAGAVCREWCGIARDPALWTESRRPCASAWLSRPPREACIRARTAAAVRASGRRAPVKISPHPPPLFDGGLDVHDGCIAVCDAARNRTIHTYVSPSPGLLPATHRHSSGTMWPSTVCMHGSRLAVITTMSGRPLLIDADRPDAPHTLFDAPPDVLACERFYGCWHGGGAALAVASQTHGNDYHYRPMALCGWDVATGMCTVATTLAVRGWVRHLRAAHGALLATVCGRTVLLLDPRAAYAPVVRHTSTHVYTLWNVVARPHAPLVAVQYTDDRVDVLDVRAFAAPLMTLRGTLAGFAGDHVCTTRKSKDITRRLADWTPLNGAAPLTTADLGPYVHSAYPRQADARRLVYGLSDGLYQLDFDGRAVAR